MSPKMADSRYDPGRVKTKSDLVVMLSGGQISAFFALNVTTSLKIPGAVIPRNVFTQPRSQPEWPLTPLMSACAGSGQAVAKSGTRSEQYSYSIIPSARRWKNKRHLDAKCLGGFEIDRHFLLDWHLDGKLTRFCTLEDAIGIGRCAPKIILHAQQM